MPKRKHSSKIPNNMQDKYKEISGWLNDFCQQKLNSEYQELSHYVLAALCRKKSSPVNSGQAASWAAGIINALGTVNFLFDKSKTLYVSQSNLATAFGLAKSTVQNKGKQIRDLLKITHFDHFWYLPSRIEQSSLAWMISFNGFIVDARELDIEIQQIAYQKGLIPYVCEKNTQNLT